MHGLRGFKYGRCGDNKVGHWDHVATLNRVPLVSQGLKPTPHNPKKAKCQESHQTRNPKVVCPCGVYWQWVHWATRRAWTEREGERERKEREKEKSKDKERQRERDRERKREREREREAKRERETEKETGREREREK